MRNELNDSIDESTTMRNVIWGVIKENGTLFSIIKSFYKYRICTGLR